MNSSYMESPVPQSRCLIPRCSVKKQMEVICFWTVELLTCQLLYHDSRILIYNSKISLPLA